MAEQNPSQHEHRVFYKYLTRDAAAATFQTMTTRWSSPMLFNDPFDTPDHRRVTFPVDAVPALAMAVMALIVEEPSRGMPKESIVAEAILAAREAPDLESRWFKLIPAAVA